MGRERHGARESVPFGDPGWDNLAGPLVSGAQPEDWPIERPQSRQINDHAVPILDREALQAQSVSGVHKVSGASLTTTAFKASLQNAMAQAHLRGA
jgi:hypothetical protein